jgi:TonB family protein
MMLMQLALALAVQHPAAPPVYAPPAPPLPSPEVRAPVRINTHVPLIGEDDYPEAALFNDQAGTTTFRLTVGTNGRASACEVLDSSGSPQLDITTCTLVRQRARFTPATRNGTPVESGWRSRIVWQIPDSSYVMVDPARAGDARVKPQPRADFYAIDPRAAPQGGNMIYPLGLSSFMYIDVDATGKVTQCSADGTMAAPLATQACSLFRGKKLFFPAADRDGDAVSDRVRVKVRW